jgi:type IV secretory pathway VirB9-like protein
MFERYLEMKFYRKETSRRRRLLPIRTYISGVAVVAQFREGNRWGKS